MSVDQLVLLDGVRDQFEATLRAAKASMRRAIGAVRLPHDIGGGSCGKGGGDIGLSASGAARDLADIAVAIGIVELNNVCDHGFSLFFWG